VLACRITPLLLLLAMLVGLNEPSLGYIKLFFGKARSRKSQSSISFPSHRVSYILDLDGTN
jgi:hypothetical protein